MPQSYAIIFDCECLTTETAPKSMWCGPYDPDPFLVQIGAVKVDLLNGLKILETKNIYVIPVDREGNRVPLDPFFTELTHITEEDIDEKGISIENTIAEFHGMGAGGMYWSWGKDDIYMIAQSCFIAGLPVPIPANRFENAAKLLLKSGIPHDDLKKTRSSGLAKYYGLEQDRNLTAHDALDDALSITYALQHLVKKGDLNPNWLRKRIDL